MPFAFKLCADDFALSPGVSRGIAEAIAAARLTTTSAMTNRPHWRASGSDIAGIASRAEIGLHFNLTLGRPLTPMPRLAPGGAFPSLGRIVSGAFLRRLPAAEIRAEIRAQLDAFGDVAGFPPDFVDGHQHVHGLPGIRDWLLEELKSRKLRRDFWIRDSADHVSRILARRLEARKALIVAGLTNGLAKAAQRSGFAANAGFAGFSAFDATRDYAADFATYLKAPGENHLVMCHPGYPDEELRAVEPVVESREVELRFFLSDAFSQVLTAAGAKLADTPPRR